MNEGKCIACNRPLKGAAALEGIGPICKQKNRSGSASDAKAPEKKIRCHLLGRRSDGSRRFVVYADDQEFRVMLDGPLNSPDGECSCKESDCEHIRSAIMVDNALMVARANREMAQQAIRKRHTSIV